MIELVQQKLNKNELCSNFMKTEEIAIHMNREILEHDIARIKQLKPKNIFDRENLKAIKKYLNKLLEHINADSIFEMCWNTDGDLPYCYPMNLINEEVYGINICNYIELNANQNLLEIKYKNLADIIAFEMMYRDLGESHESIEDLLKDCGVLGYQPCSLLTDMFKECSDNIYQLSQSMKIDDTPYYMFEEKKVRDYFSSKLFKKDYYKDVVNYSCKYALTIIANELLKKSIAHNIDMKPVMLSTTTVAFIVNGSSNESIKHDILEDVSIRVFGRRFTVDPTVQIL